MRRKKTKNLQMEKSANILHSFIKISKEQTLDLLVI